MEKRFDIKIQKIGDAVPDKATSFSTPLVLESEDAVFSRRGSLYAVVDVSASKNFDASLVLKIITDTIQSEYFGNPEGTPLQCLEKTITDLRDKVKNLLSASANEVDWSEFRIVTAVLWGSVLYVIQYGDGCSYLVREGKIKPINSSTEGSFSVASGMVNDKDIIVIGSKLFCEKYPSETLLSATSSSVSGVGLAAIILKFSVEKPSFPAQALDIRDSSIKVNRADPLVSKRVVLGFVAVIVGILLALSVYSSSRKSEVSKSPLISEQKPQAPKIEEPVEADVVFVEDKPFYDLKLDDKEANPSELASATSQTVLVAERARNKLFKLYVQDAARLIAVESTQSQKPRFLTPSNSGAVFQAADGFYLYDGGNGKVSRIDVKLDFSMDSVTAASSYLGNIYLVKDSTIYKNGVVWAAEDPLKDAVSMAIDGNVYVLTKGGAVLKYYSGKKESDFSLKGLVKPLNQPAQVYTSADLSNLYILDRGNERVVIFGTDGLYKKQFKLKAGVSSWNDLKALTVTKDEKSLFVLSGSKVYKIAL